MLGSPDVSRTFGRKQGSKFFRLLNEIPVLLSRPPHRAFLTLATTNERGTFLESYAGLVRRQRWAVASALALVVLTSGLIIDTGFNLYHVAKPSKVVAAPVVHVIGKLYSDEGVTPIDCTVGGNRTVAVSVNGAAPDTADCSTNDGAFSVTSLSPVVTGDTITVFLDGEVEKAVAVTRAANAGVDITGFDLYQNRLIIRQEGGTATTNTDLGMYDHDNDSDIPFTSNGGALVVNSGIELHIWTGKTFNPGGSVTTDTTGGDLHLDDSTNVTLDTVTNTIGRNVVVDPSSMLSINSNTIINGGNIQSTGSGTVTASSGTPTVTINGNGTIGGGSSDFDFYNLVMTGNATISVNLIVANNFSMNANTISGSSFIAMQGASGTIQSSGGIVDNLALSSHAVTTTTLASNSILTVSTAFATLFNNQTLNLGTNSQLRITGIFSLTSASIISGPGQLVFTNTSDGPGTIATISAPVRFDATNGDISSSTFDARTYDGPVELYIGNTATADRTVRCADNSSYILSGSSSYLYLIDDDDNNLTLNCDTATDPTMSIGGNLDFTGTGSGSEAITSGSGTWTVDGNVDFSGGTFTATNGNTIVMTGNGKTMVAGNQQLDNFTVTGSVTSPQGTGLVLDGLLNVGAGATLTINTIVKSASTGMVVLDSTGTITGNGALEIFHGNLSTVGTLSVPVNFYADDQDLTIPTRTYGGDVGAVVSDSTTLHRTIFLNSGNYLFQGLFELQNHSLSGKSLTLDASNSGSANPSVTINGDFQACGATNCGGSAISLNFGSGTWAVGGNMNLTDVTRVNHDSGTITMNGMNKTFTSNGKTLNSFSITGGSITMNGAATFDGNLTIASGALTAPSSALIVSGNFTNSGTFTHNSGTLTLNGTGQQTVTMKDQALYNLTLTNTSGVVSGCSTSFTPGIIFSDSVTVANTYSITSAGVNVQYHSGSTYTFKNVTWNSGAPRITFRNSDLVAGSWKLVISGSKNIYYIDVAGSDASGTNSGITATNTSNIDCGNNTNWRFAASTVTTTQPALAVTPGLVPAPTLLHPVVVGLTNPTIYVTGVSKGNATVKIFLGSKLIGSTAVSGTIHDTKSFTLSTKLVGFPAGTYAVSAQAIQPIARTSSLRQQYTVAIGATQNQPSYRFTSDLTYIVQRTNTLWRIAQVFLGRGQEYTRLVSSNQQRWPTLSTMPRLIYAGWQLLVPR